MAHIHSETISITLSTLMATMDGVPVGDTPRLWPDGADQTIAEILVELLKDANLNGLVVEVDSSGGK